MQNTKQLITRLGGPSVVAQWLEIRPQAVSLWIAKNAVPLDRVPDLLRLAHERCVPLTAHDIRPDFDWPTACKAVA